ncbi:MAG TPA: fumarate reductase/succinate dehydrogenase flavoprotein subunit, partial [Saprospiraceae bacterium]|nr:fumarate reductase/succinate dehydrogenase flavoprotein subunit [Saprospiraceae bacterium]
IRTGDISTQLPAFEEAEKQTRARIDQLMNVKGNQSVESFHRRLGKIMWDLCGMSRNAEGLQEGRKLIRQLRDEFYKDVYVPGNSEEFNPELEKAYRVADFLELGELMMIDAFERNESCGGHFREEFQTGEGEAQRDDENYTYVAAWKWDDQQPELTKENLVFENVKLIQRSYK